MHTCTHDRTWSLITHDHTWSHAHMSTFNNHDLPEDFNSYAFNGGGIIRQVLHSVAQCGAVLRSVARAHSHTDLLVLGHMIFACLADVYLLRPTTSGKHFRVRNDWAGSQGRVLSPLEGDDAGLQIHGHLVKIQTKKGSHSCLNFLSRGNIGYWGPIAMVFRYN